MKARFYTTLEDGSVACELCPHGCVIADGKRGNCLVRENRAGILHALTYARTTSVAMDPIEKKPLYHFLPGSEILSIGSWGCNLHCRFCQNYSISQQETPTEELAPENAVRLARGRGSIGIAYTYNEPFIAWEYVHDCGNAIRAAGLKNILVTNGFVNEEPLTRMLPVVDAMNIDIKAFHNGFYSKLCQGDMEPVLRTARTAARECHVEITTLVVPEHNDAPKELDELASWIAENCGRDTPAHLSAYFPRYKMTGDPTPEQTLRHAREIFMQHLDYVYLGNVASTDGSDTICHGCGATVISRQRYSVNTDGMKKDGTCAGCGAGNNILN